MKTSTLKAIFVMMHHATYGWILARIYREIYWKYGISGGLHHGFSPDGAQFNFQNAPYQFQINRRVIISDVFF